MQNPQRTPGLALLAGGLLVVAYGFWRNGTNLAGVAGNVWFGLALFALAFGFTMWNHDDGLQLRETLIILATLMAFAAIFVLVGAGLTPIFWLWAIIAAAAVVVWLWMKSEEAQATKR